MSQFVDQVRIKVRSGDGGNGIVAWRREKYEPLGGPAGGNGGRGGHVYLCADKDICTLLDFHYRSHFKADNGERGRSKGMHGRHGEDLVVKVPVGTVVKDASGAVIADLVDNGQTVLVAEGGKGGRGNKELATPTRRAPYFCEPGQAGIARELELELKLLADVGIIGMPNAGKSTLLSIMTAAHPKIADYPFSTLEPNLGVVKKPDGDGYVLADIPGLVKGASQGVGLGHKFLRHVERTRLLIHLADISSINLEEDIATVNAELHLYSEAIDKVPQLIVLNKSDLLDRDKAQEITARIKGRLQGLLAPGGSAGANEDVIAISCLTGEGVTTLKNMLLERLSKLPPRLAIHAIEADMAAYEHPHEGFVITRKKDVFTVHGDRVERLVAVTDMRSPESLYHLYQVLRNIGVIEALMKEGAKPGCEVVIGRQSFEFGPEFM